MKENIYIIIGGVLLVFIFGYEQISQSTNIPNTIQEIETLFSGTGQVNIEKTSSGMKNSVSGTSDLPTREDNSVNISKQNIFLETYELNGNLNHLIEITGSGKENIAYINIGGINFTPIESEKKYYIAINKKTFIAGEYFIIINYKKGNIESLSEKLKISFDDSKLNIGELNPKSISNESDKYITVVGNGFSKIISVQLSNNVILKKTNFKIINDNAIGVLIPAGLEPGEYYLNIMTVESVYELKDMKFTIN